MEGLETRLFRFRQSRGSHKALTFVSLFRKPSHPTPTANHFAANKKYFAVPYKIPLPAHPAPFGRPSPLDRLSPRLATIVEMVNSLLAWTEDELQYLNAVLRWKDAPAEEYKRLSDGGANDALSKLDLQGSKSVQETKEEEIMILVLGAEGVGKTALVQKVCRNAPNHLRSRFASRRTQSSSDKANGDNCSERKLTPLVISCASFF